MSREDIEEAIEEAIEVLEDASAEMLVETGDKNYYIEAIAVLRQALVDADDTSQERVDEKAKDRHEPVAWASSLDFDDDDQEIIPAKDKGKLGTSNCDIPLYTAPPKREWVGLTEKEVKAIANKRNDYGLPMTGRMWVFVADLTDKLKEKNT